VDEDPRLSSSFGTAATAYAEHRPDYAGAAVRWALEAVPGRRVLDLGAGTGKLTAGLLATGAEVTAVESDPEMLAELRWALPDVRALADGAESIPLPDGSVDAEVAGNAMHWFDMDVAGPEIARVLAPGVDAPPVLRRLVPGSTSPEQAEFPHGQPRTADSLVATLATRAGVLVMPDDEREELLGRIRAYLASRPETAQGEFILPMLTCVLRVRVAEGWRGPLKSLCV
jgi:SAM-dependent methyltransferase